MANIFDKLQSHASIKGVHFFLKKTEFKFNKPLCLTQLKEVSVSVHMYDKQTKDPQQPLTAQFFQRLLGGFSLHVCFARHHPILSGL